MLLGRVLVILLLVLHASITFAFCPAALAPKSVGYQSLCRTSRTRPEERLSLLPRASALNGAAKEVANQEKVGNGKTPVIVCPAQFGTPADYEELVELLDRRGFQAYVAPLSRVDWLKIVPSTLTKEFFTASLVPSKTLGFFYEAIDEALESASRKHGNTCQVAFLGHSIGGWVARSYIGERLQGADTRVRSLVTLGTPNNPPPKESAVAALDQTRGLLTFINDKFPAGAPLPSDRVTCVAGSGTKVPKSLAAIFENYRDKLWDDKAGRSLLIEELVALSSYLPLSGTAFGVAGDGLIPVDTALMPECRSLVLEDCNHAAFIPTPGASVKLPDSYLWYGSPSMIDSWVHLL